jgi:hypothetical protein
MSFRPVLLALVFLCAVATTAQGTTVLRVDVPQMADTSQWIVQATVTEVEYVDEAYRGGGIFTDVHLSIAEVHKGVDVPDRYVLRLIGGQGADGKTLKIPGMPVFTPGEDVILFLERTSLGHIPCGLGQGVFRVVATPGADLWVRRSAGGVNLLKRDHQGRLQPTALPVKSDAQPLDHLLDEVYDHLYSLP